jgi:hypothetical protein
LGTILHGDVAPRETWKHRLITLMAILGPGLIVMVGDNDAGAFATLSAAQRAGKRENAVRHGGTQLRRP